MTQMVNYGLNLNHHACWSSSQQGGKYKVKNLTITTKKMTKKKDLSNVPMLRPYVGFNVHVDSDFGCKVGFNSRRSGGAPLAL